MGFHKDELNLLLGSPEDLIEGHLRRLMDRNTSNAPWEETDSPPLDIYETTETIIVELDLPGVDSKDIEVSVSAGTLVVEATKREVLEPGRINFLCMERTFGTFRRMVPFLHPVDVSRIKVTYKAGILVIRIPKLRERRGARTTIPVTTE